MKTKIHSFYITLIAFSCAVIFSSFIRNNSSNEKITLPYKQAGLTEQQAAAHLLSRFTYGARKGDVDAVVKAGLVNWLLTQLDGNIQDSDLDQKLTKYDALNLTNTEVENIYPRNNMIARFAVKDGYLNKDSIGVRGKQYQEDLARYRKDKGYKNPQDFYRQFFAQKILRATYSKNQLRELMTDFWFNHFNVALSKNQCGPYIPAFERDVIRPNVFGTFENLLLSTAKSPAMLMYLDNSSSSGNNVPMQAPADEMMMTAMPNQKSKKAQKKKFAPVEKKKNGLNENYAREVMELHTLGVDGGYTQSDVTQAARVLTGWTVAPMGEIGYGASARKMIDRIGEDNLAKRGYVRDGDFLFAVNRHDNGEKTVLGKKFPAGGGYEEGVELLTMLAHHPSAAKFISKKLATRFVSDNPPKSLIDKMAKTFLNSNGDIKSVMITMISAPEFWSADALREKTKSPFELAISAVRSLDAKVDQPFQLYSWINKMGQQMYYYQAPTGFPDRGQYWINTGSLLNRMNFGLALASQRIPGIRFSLAAMNNNREPESAEAALLIYSKLIMPERDLEATIARLKPMLNDPNLEQNVAKAAEQNTAPKPMNAMMNEDDPMVDSVKKAKGKKNLVNGLPGQKEGTNTMLSQVVGVIIGSPEFQRK